MRGTLFLAIFVFILGGLLSSGYSSDNIKLAPIFSTADKRYNYPDSVLRTVLDSTVESDGPYTISYAPIVMKRNRALTEIVKGDLLNVHVAATREEWEEKTIPIRVPILKGLLGYRLFLIHKKDQEKFGEIINIDQLKSLRAGSGEQWTTSMVLRNAGFELVTGGDYEGLFEMLISNRFDYFPRGVNEIFEEFEGRKEKLPDLQIEPTKALYFPTPSYFFVSPKYPELADRIRRGLAIMVQDGSLDKLFNKAFQDSISRAKLNERNIFRCENPLLSPETPLKRAELWYTPSSD